MDAEQAQQGKEHEVESMSGQEQQLNKKGRQQGRQGKQQEERCPLGFFELLADVRSRVAAGQLLGAQPMLAMRRLLAAVKPLHLQHDIERQLPTAEAAAAASAAAATAAATAVCAAAAAAAAAAGAVGSKGTGAQGNSSGSGEGSKGAALAAALSSCNQHALAAQLQAATVLDGGAPPFALTTPKLAVLAGQLMQYRGAAIGAVGPAGTSGPPSAAWCGIVFCTQVS